MRVKLIRQFVLVIAIQFLFVAQSMGVSSSTNYSINEDQVGGSGGVDSASTNFKSLGSTDGGNTLGESAVGNSTSTNFQTNSGYNTSNSPVLGITMGITVVNLGTLTTAAPSTGIATFSVINYTSYGYIVQIVGPAPSNNGHPLTSLSSGGTSAIGTEQFGINVVSNTSPSTFGAVPVQIPDSTFSFGQANSGYLTNGNFRYNTGDTIAKSLKSSGQTNFTISYLANISPITPAGFYTSSQSLICTATF